MELSDKFDYNFIDPIDLFCDASKCVQNEGLNVFYKDANHLTTFGAKIVASEISKRLKKLTTVEDKSK